MMGKRERQAWVKVFELMRELTYLYGRQNPLYTDQRKRQEGYNLLLEVFNDISGQEREMRVFKKKLENMRTTFMKERKKVYESKLTAYSSDSVYKPTLWHYPLMDFLEGATEIPHTEVYIFDEGPELLDIKEDSPPTMEKLEYKREASVTPRSITPKRLRKSLKANLSKKLTDDHQLHTARKLEPQKESEWELIGRSIGLQMRDMDEQQQIIAQKIINDAMYYGRMGRLTEQSQISLNSDVMFI